MHEKRFRRHLNVNIILSFISIVLLFMPYMGNTRLRPDNVLLMLLLLCFPVVLFYIRDMKILLYLIVSVAPLCYLVVRLLWQFDWSQAPLFFRFINQYSMLCSGGILYIFLRKFGVNFVDYGQSLLFVSCIISIFAIFQFVYRDSLIVEVISNLYGRKREFPGIDHAITMTQYALMNHRASSFFTQPSSLGAFSLLAVALGFQLLRFCKQNMFVVFSILLALIAGILSSTKVFLLGIAILLTLIFLPRISLGSLVKLFITLVLFLVLLYLSKNQYVVDLVVNINEQGFFNALFGSRFAEGGYLDNSVTSIFHDPGIMIHGLGLNLNTERYSDSMPVMVVMLGGGLFLLLFYLPVVTLFFIVSCSGGVSRKLPIISLHVVYLLVSIAFPVYIQNRLVPIFVVASLLAVNYRPLRVFRVECDEQSVFA